MFHTLKTRFLIAALFVTLLSVFASKAHAQSRDKWGDTHNWFHFVGEAAAGGVASYYIENPYEAFAVGMIPGILREEYKRAKGFDHYSRSRMTFDVVGDALGVWGVHVIFYRDDRQTVIAYQTTF